MILTKLPWNGITFWAHRINRPPTEWTMSNINTFFVSFHHHFGKLSYSWIERGFSSVWFGICKNVTGIFKSDSEGGRTPYKFCFLRWSRSPKEFPQPERFIFELDVCHPDSEPIYPHCNPKRTQHATCCKTNSANGGCAKTQCGRANPSRSSTNRDNLHKI